jgi:hypothetical protein
MNSTPGAAGRTLAAILGGADSCAISMLSDPNDESPANLDAAVMWRNDKLALKEGATNRSERARKNAKVFWIVANTGGEPWRKHHDKFETGSHT